jgi:hypothetical protein
MDRLYHEYHPFNGRYYIQHLPISWMHLFITPVIYLALDRYSGSGPLKLAGDA